MPCSSTNAQKQALLQATAGQAFYLTGCELTCGARMYKICSMQCWAATFGSNPTTNAMSSHAANAFHEQAKQVNQHQISIKQKIRSHVSIYIYIWIVFATAQYSSLFVWRYVHTLALDFISLSQSCGVYVSHHSQSCPRTSLLQILFFPESCHKTVHKNG